MANMTCQWSINEIVKRARGEGKHSKAKGQNCVQVSVLRYHKGKDVGLFCSVVYPIAWGTWVLNMHLWINGCMTSFELFNFSEAKFSYLQNGIDTIYLSAIMRIEWYNICEKKYLMQTSIIHNNWLISGLLHAGHWYKHFMHINSFHPHSVR